ncbi:MAG: TonB-dependent receptor plug domain-containing protein [Chitinophagales bacterium]
MKHYFAITFLVSVLTLTAGQVKLDTFYLPVVVKTEVFTSGKTMNSFEQLELKAGRRLSDVLSEASSVYVKNYGNGQLASLAIRGTSSTQTEVQWEGIKLNNAALGQTDLSLFLLGLHDRLSLARTGYRGTIGGTVQMNSIGIDSGIQISGLLRAGSFGTLEGYAGLDYAGGNWSGQTRLVYQTSKNDFLFRNTYKEGAPREKQTNARVRTVAFLQNAKWRINEHNELLLAFWLTDANRQLAPIMSKPGTREQQFDNSLRFIAAWKGSFHNIQISFKSAMLTDAIRYQNPESKIDSKSQTQAWRSIATICYQPIAKLALMGEMNYDLERGLVPAYDTDKIRQTGGVRVYADYYPSKAFTVHAGFRQDVMNSSLSPFAPELWLHYRFSNEGGHGFTAGLIGSRNFRFPTLNDLYWTPGGNPSLKTEKAWNAELNLTYSYKRYVKFTASTFAIYVNDWIQWVSKGTYWQPENFKRVFSKGAECSVDIGNDVANNTNRLGIRFHAAYSFTAATNLDAQSAYDQSAGKQLIYVPYHNFTSYTEFSYKRFYLRSYNHYNGAVYISTDNSQSLPGFYLCDIEFGKDFAFRDNQIGVSFRVNNVAGRNYQTVAQRPMPGRSFEGTLRFNLKR